MIIRMTSVRIVKADCPSPKIIPIFVVTTGSINTHRPRCPIWDFCSPLVAAQRDSKNYSILLSFFAAGVAAVVVVAAAAVDVAGSNKTW